MKQPLALLGGIQRLLNGPSIRDRLEAVAYATIALENAFANVDVEVGKNAMLWAVFVDELRLVLRRRHCRAA